MLMFSPELESIARGTLILSASSAAGKLHFFFARQISSLSIVLGSGYLRRMDTDKSISLGETSFRQNSCFVAPTVPDDGNFVVSGRLQSVNGLGDRFRLTSTGAREFRKVFGLHFLVPRKEDHNISMTRKGGTTEGG